MLRCTYIYYLFGFFSRFYPQKYVKLGQGKSEKFPHVRLPISSYVPSALMNSNSLFYPNVRFTNALCRLFN